MDMGLSFFTHSNSEGGIAERVCICQGIRVRVLASSFCPHDVGQQLAKLLRHTELSFCGACHELLTLPQKD